MLSTHSVAITSDYQSHTSASDYPPVLPSRLKCTYIHTILLPDNLYLGTVNLAAPGTRNSDQVDGPAQRQF